jgi:hypothetical protein
MNLLQQAILEKFINEQLVKNDNLITATLIQALNTTEENLLNAIMEIIKNQAFVENDQMKLDTYEIDEIVCYGNLKKLDFTLGFSTILESYVMSTLTEILEIDLIELV